MKDHSFDFKKIDPVIHSRIRLAIMALLLEYEEVEFNFIKEQLKTTDGNLSVHLRKLEEVEYIKIDKRFIDRKPHTFCSLTQKGRDAFENYIKNLENFIKK